VNKKPIGIFDSGVGGSSIWKEIHKLLPNEHTIYLADSKFAPYGPKGPDKIKELSVKNVELLLSKECKLIVVACNTATTNAIDYLRSHYDIPFVGIEPAIKPAALKTKTKIVGILATKGTLSSTLFHKTANLYGHNILKIEQEGEGIVQLIESGNLYSVEMTYLLKNYLEPMIKANIDYLVLGCTHYSYLIPILKELLPKHIRIVDSGQSVARQVKSVLQTNQLLNVKPTFGRNEFFTNDNPDVLTSLLGNNFNVGFLDF
jgi:glutamate racemase